MTLEPFVEHGGEVPRRLRVGTLRHDISDVPGQSRAERNRTPDPSHGFQVGPAPVARLDPRLLAALSLNRTHQSEGHGQCWACPVPFLDEPEAPLRKQAERLGVAVYGSTVGRGSDAQPKPRYRDFVNVHSNSAAITNRGLRRAKQQVALDAIPRCSTPRCRKRVSINRRWGQMAPVSNRCPSCRKRSVV